MDGHEKDHGHYVERTGRIALHAAPEVVFPLFGPDREREWAVGWEPEPVYPGTVVAHDGVVFRTRHSGDVVWVVNSYDEAARYVAYTNFKHDERVTRIWITVEADPVHDGWSVAEVSYAIVALSERGTQYVLHFDESHYASMMREWEDAINDALAGTSGLQ